LAFALLWWIGRFLDHLVQVDGAQTPPGHGSDNLDFYVTSKIFWYPFQIGFFTTSVAERP